MKISLKPILISLVLIFLTSASLTAGTGNLFINGESTIQDENGTHSITANGDTSISTAEKKYGVSSVYFDGNADYLSAPDSDDWDLGVGDFTIDLWVKHNIHDGEEFYLTQDINTGSHFRFIHLGGTGIKFTYSNSWVKEIELVGGEITDTNWHHIAIVRSGNTYTGYLDGVSFDSDSSAYSISMSAPLVIGTQWDRAHGFHGYMDNIRVTKGTALWTADFNLTEQELFYSDAGTGIIVPEVPTTEYALEVEEDGKVSINSVLHLKPRSSPPANPSSGDIYFTTTDELLLYANGKWNGVFAADANHATAQLTSGSGKWTVPAGIYSITVSLTGGGGSGGPGYCLFAQQENQCCAPGGTGGHGGVILNRHIDVTPGQQFSYSVGSPGAVGYPQGGTTTFGTFSASGGSMGTSGTGSTGTGYTCYPGSNGSNGSPYEGTYPYAHGGGGNGGPGQSGAIAIQY